MTHRRFPRPDATEGSGLPMPGPWDVPLELWARVVAHSRHDRGLSQCALAAAAGVTQQSISKIEQGEICPHDRLKVRLAEALDVPTATLFPWPSLVLPTPTGECAWPDLPGLRLAAADA